MYAVRAATLRRWWVPAVAAGVVTGLLLGALVPATDASAGTVPLRLPSSGPPPISFSQAERTSAETCPSGAACDLPPAPRGTTNWNLPVARQSLSISEPEATDVTETIGFPALGPGLLEVYDPTLGNGALLAIGPTESEFPSPGQNQTSVWEYNGSSWEPLHPPGPTAPPILTNPSTDFDPALGGIVLEGENPYSGAGGETWLLNASGWSNLSATLAAAGGASPDVRYASMAWDGSTQSLVLVDGCEGACDSFAPATWSLTDRWRALALANLSGPEGPNASGLAGGAMVYDPTLGDLLYFGGYTNTDFYRGLPPESATFVFNGLSWSNVTGTSAGCPSGCYPAAVPFPLFAWDTGMNEAFLFGPTVFGFSGTSWHPVTWTGVTQPFWQWGGYGAVPENCSNAPPLLVAYGESIAWEPQPKVNLSVAGDAADAGHTVLASLRLEGSATGPAARWSVDWGDSNQSETVAQAPGASSPPMVELPHAYARNGSYLIRSSVEDFLGVDGASRLTINVSQPIFVSASASSELTEAGGEITLRAAASLGTPPLSYRWSFGDGASANGSTATHAYADSGNYTATVQVTDATGAMTGASVSLRALAHLSVTASTTFPQTDVYASEQFFALTSGGSGAVTALKWDFNDGNFSSQAIASHAFYSYGFFPVRVSATDSLGFSTSATVGVQVNSWVGAFPFYGPSPGTALSPVYFLPNASGGTPPIAYEWSFGDGTTSPRGDTTHVYLAAGTYPVILWANDSYGSHYAAHLNVNILPVPEPAPRSVAPSNLTPVTSNSNGYFELSLGVGGALGMAVGLLARTFRRSR
jgi:PKD repeat protein